jgi:hypothetical protein
MTTPNKNRNGSYKYDMGLSFNIRFDIASDDVDLAAHAAGVIRERISEFVQTNPELNAEFNDQIVSSGYRGWRAIKVTHIDTPLYPVVDHASDRPSRPNVWLEGTWSSLRSLAELWGNKLRFLDRTESNNRYRFLDTAESTRHYTMPSVPDSVLRSIVTEYRQERSNVNSTDIHVEPLRERIVTFIEGLYEDCVELPKPEPEVQSNGYGADTIDALIQRAADVANAATPRWARTVTSQPEPF